MITELVWHAPLERGMVLEKHEIVPILEVLTEEQQGRQNRHLQECQREVDRGLFEKLIRGLESGKFYVIRFEERTEDRSGMFSVEYSAKAVFWEVDPVKGNLLRAVQIALAESDSDNSRRSDE